MIYTDSPLLEGSRYLWRWGLRAVISVCTGRALQTINVPLSHFRKKKKHLENEWEHQEQLIPLPRKPSPASGTKECSTLGPKKLPFQGRGRWQYLWVLLAGSHWLTPVTQRGGTPRRPDRSGQVRGTRKHWWIRLPITGR